MTASGRALADRARRGCGNRKPRRRRSRRAKDLRSAGFARTAGGRRPRQGGKPGLSALRGPEHRRLGTRERSGALSLQELRAHLRRRHQEPAQLSRMATGARGLRRSGHSAKTGSSAPWQWGHINGKRNKSPCLIQEPCLIRKIAAPPTGVAEWPVRLGGRVSRPDRMVLRSRDRLSLTAGVQERASPPAGRPRPNHRRRPDTKRHWSSPAPARAWPHSRTSSNP